MAVTPRCCSRRWRAAMLQRRQRSTRRAIRERAGARLPQGGGERRQSAPAVGDTRAHSERQRRRMRNRCAPRVRVQSDASARQPATEDGLWRTSRVTAAGRCWQRAVLRSILGCCQRQVRAPLELRHCTASTARAAHMPSSDRSDHAVRRFCQVCFSQAALQETAAPAVGAMTAKQPAMPAASSSSAPHWRALRKPTARADKLQCSGSSMTAVARPSRCATAASREMREHPLETKCDRALSSSHGCTQARSPLPLAVPCGTPRERDCATGRYQQPRVDTGSLSVASS